MLRVNNRRLTSASTVTWTAAEPHLFRRGYQDPSSEDSRLSNLNQSAYANTLLESSDPESGDVIEIAIAPTGLPEDMHAHRNAVLAFGFSLQGTEDLKRACYPYLNLFTSLAAYEKWCRKHPEALTVPLTLDQACRLALRWARATRST